MGFFKQHIASIDGVDIYPIISLLIFFTFFGLVTWYAMKAPKRMMDENQNLPFDDSTVENSSK